MTKKKREEEFFWGEVSQREKVKRSLMGRYHKEKRRTRVFKSGITKRKGEEEFLRQVSQREKGRRVCWGGTKKNQMEPEREEVFS